MKAQNTDIELELRKFVAPEYIFGLDARKLAPNYCKNLGAKKVLLVSDSGISKTPWLNELITGLENQGIDSVIYTSVSPNPRDNEVMTGAELYNENHCNLVLALGGGSVIDCAKGIGIVAANKRHIHVFEGIDKISSPIPPLICIPTTSGTSADVSQFAIINNYHERYKMAIISKAVVPDVALIDPLVLTTMDSYLTSCTGMDALSHAFEAYVSNASSPFTDLYALEAIRLINENLLKTIQSPDDIQARGKMMLGSLYAGLAFSNASLGCVHSLAHSLGGYLDLPHGECNAILLPHVVDFNFSSVAEKYKIIATTMNIPISGLSDNETHKKIVEYLVHYKEHVGINSTLKHKGVKEDMISPLSERSIKDPCNATNPKPPVKRDMEVIYSESM